MRQLTEFDEKIRELTEKIEKEPENAKLYLARSNYYEKIGKNENAIEDLSKTILFDPKIAQYYLFRSLCYKKIKKYQEAIEDVNKALALEPNNNIQIYYSHRGSCYQDIEKYDEAIEDYTWAIKYNPDDITLYILRSFAYQKINRPQDALNDYNKIIEINPKKTIGYQHRCMLYLSQIKDYNKALEDFEKAQFDDPYFYKKFLRYIFEGKNEKEKEQARIEERNKILADLSHSIKNLIATVIDPLENLKNETVVQPQIIQNALRGANLIREIVNAVNLSFKGSMDDFVYDAKHNAGKDSVNLQSMLIESLRQSVGNMFDSKYFGNFMRKYFPKKEHYIAAKAEWTDISQSKDLKSLEQFLKSYFFETDFSVEHAQSYAIGNEKGSAVKLLILFQELILNAVKYSAFVSKEKRFLRIHFTSNADTISVKVENPFDERTKTKTTGIGHVVIQNFAKLLNTEPVISKENSVYCVVIQFENLWKGSAR